MIALPLDWLTVTAGPPWPCGAADHRAARGPARSRSHAQRDERRGCQYEIAKTWMHRNGTAMAKRLDEGEPLVFSVGQGRGE